ncbi:MAG: superoxide dismutase [Anaerolineae bacterium]|nr:superoxide dismutase [Anaerolineae bacterium]
MKFLALEVEAPGLTAADFAPHSRDEAARVWELVKAGLIRETYFNPDDHTAVLILEAADRAEAQQALDSLPMVQAGLIRFDLVPLAPYTGFERLFGDTP